MDFIQSSNKQVDKFGPGRHGFSAGNPSGGILATFMTPEFCDDVMMELINLIEGGGVTPTAGQRNQALLSVQAMISSAIAAAFGKDYKDSVRYTTTGNITLSGLGTQAGGDWPSALTDGDLILVKDQSTGSQNGIYIAASGAWTRASDADGIGDLTSGAIVPVEEGTANPDSQWMLTTDGAITIGTTTLTFARKDAGGASGVEPGAVMAFAMSSAPTGWLKANGAAISRTTYAALFAAIGTTFGSGDGSTTFNLPDARGEFIRGWDDSRGVDSGRAFGSSQTDAFKSHNHSGGYQDIFGSAGGIAGIAGTVSGDRVTKTAAVPAQGGTETRPRNIAFLVCIKY